MNGPFRAASAAWAYPAIRDQPAPSTVLIPETQS
jgi:hypothetical protein